MLSLPAACSIRNLFRLINGCCHIQDNLPMLLPFLSWNLWSQQIRNMDPYRSVLVWSVNSLTFFEWNHSCLGNQISMPYNQALKHKTAPGSTFKPVSALAGLNEKAITTSTVINCTGLYDKITPPAKCWKYPDRHGARTVSSAIEASCNYFF